MNKKLIIGVAVFLIIAVVGGFVFVNKAQSKEEFIIYEAQLVRDAVRAYFIDNEGIMPDGVAIYNAAKLQLLVADNMVYDTGGKVAKLKSDKYYDITNTIITEGIDTENDGRYLIDKDLDVIYIDVVVIDEWLNPAKPDKTSGLASGSSNIKDSSNNDSNDDDVILDEEADKYTEEDLTEEDIKDIIKQLEDIADEYIFAEENDLPLYQDKAHLIDMASKGNVYGILNEDEIVSADILSMDIDDFLKDPSCAKIAYDKYGWDIEDHLFYPFDAVYVVPRELVLELTGYNMPGDLIYYYDLFEGGLDDVFCYDIGGSAAFILD